MRHPVATSAEHALCRVNNYCAIRDWGWWHLLFAFYFPFFVEMKTVTTNPSRRLLLLERLKERQDREGWGVYVRVCVCCI